MVLPLTVVLSATALIFLAVVDGQSLRNITVDDRDLSMITYSGGWRTSASADSFNRQHAYSSLPNSYASFKFTGVAVYAMMPLFSDFPDGVSTLLSLDGGATQMVNLTQVGSESKTSTVRWNATNLSSQTHTLTISLGGQSSWGIVDAFMYTVADSSPGGPSPPAPTPTLSGVVNLQRCRPCGQSKCSFSPNGEPSYDQYRLVISQPVSNCDPRSNSTVSAQFTKEMEVTETWSVDNTPGISYEGLELSGTGGWSKSASRKVGQTVIMSIPSGKMGALTVYVSYKRTRGNMRIDSDTFVFNSIQPTDTGVYDVLYDDCGGLLNTFNASIFNSIPGCDSSKSAASTTLYSMELVSLMGIAVLWSLS